MYFLVTKIVLQPLPLLLAGLGLSLALLWRKAAGFRGRLAFGITCYLGLVFITVPAVVHPALYVTESRYAPLAQRPDGIDAIVVLGGGIVEAEGPRLHPELTEDTVDRCLHAAELYHQGPHCPVIVSGGRLDPNGTVPALAPVMKDFLVKLGVNAADILVEPNSTTTFENAVESRKILESRGLRRVLLVTEALHMPRSMACFRKQGVDVVAAPCAFRATRFPRSLGGYLPHPEALNRWMAVLHEWLGLIAYRASGKI